MFCFVVRCVHSSFAIILIRLSGKELVVFLRLSSLCLGIVVWLFLTVSLVCQEFVIVVFPVHTHLLFWSNPTHPYKHV